MDSTVRSHQYLYSVRIIVRTWVKCPLRPQSEALHIPTPSQWIKARKTETAGYYLGMLIPKRQRAHLQGGLPRVTPTQELSFVLNIL